MSTPASPAVRRLALARGISVTGSLAAYAALLDEIFRSTRGSAAWLSATLFLTIGAVGLFGPLGGAVADRFDRRKVMIGSDLAAGLAFFLMAFLHVPAALLAAAFCSAVFETPFRAASVAAIPNIAGRDEIARANGLIGLGTNIGFTVGPAIGGVLAAWVGSHAVYLANAASFALSALIVSSLRVRFQTERTDSETEHRGVVAGFRFIRRDRVLLLLTVSWMVLTLGAGFGVVADRPLSAHFHMGSIGFGLIIGLFGLGSVVGSAWAARKLNAEREPAAAVFGFVIAAAAGVGIWLAPWFALVLVCNFAWGVSDSITLVGEQGIMQRRTPDAVRSRVAAASESAVHSTLMIAFVAAAPVLGSLGPKPTYLLGGVAALCGAVVSFPIIGMMRRSKAEQRLSPEWGVAAIDTSRTSP